MNSKSSEAGIPSSPEQHSHQHHHHHHHHANSDTYHPLKAALVKSESLHSSKAEQNHSPPPKHSPSPSAPSSSPSPGLQFRLERKKQQQQQQQQQNQQQNQQKQHERERGPEKNRWVLEHHREQMWKDGYTQFDKVVPQSLLDSALRAINAKLGQGIATSEAENFINGQCFKELCCSAVITDLYYKSNVADIAAQFLGGKIAKVHAGQIALRFPGTMCTDQESFTPVPWWNKGWHIDGLASTSNSLPKGKIGLFTCLLGVVLQDIPSDYMGNLIVYPGSHRILEQYFQENGVQALLEQGDQGLPKSLPFRPARQIVAKAGDVILTHYMTAHSIAPNSGPHIRYMVYFRLNVEVSQDSENPRYDPMFNIWMDWANMHEFVATNSSLNPHESVANEEDVRVLSLQDEGERLLKEKKFQEAQSIFADLCQLRPNDTDFHVKAADVHCRTCKLEHAVRGEIFGRTAAQLAPGLPTVHAILARLLITQRKYAEALVASECMLACFVPQDRTYLDAYIIDGMKCGLEASEVLRQTERRKQLLHVFKSKYPELVSKVAQATEVEDLWHRGESFIHAPVKDWIQGQKIFSRLCELEPDSFWANLQACICYNYGPRATVAFGERYALESIQIDPTSPLGHAVLARCFFFQGKYNEAINAVECMINCQDTFGEHEVLIVEGVRAARDSCRALKDDSKFYDDLLPKLRRTFASHAYKIDALATEAACCIM